MFVRGWERGTGIIGRKEGRKEEREGGMDRCERGRKRTGEREKKELKYNEF